MFLGLQWETNIIKMSFEALQVKASRHGSHKHSEQMECWMEALFKPMIKENHKANNNHKMWTRENFNISETDEYFLFPPCLKHGCCCAGRLVGYKNHQHILHLGYSSLIVSSFIESSFSFFFYIINLNCCQMKMKIFSFIWWWFFDVGHNETFY